jgi:hypothetical protein
MPDLFGPVSAFTVFLLIGLVGFVFLLVSLIFGEVFDLMGSDVDHDFGLGHGGPSFFSGRVLSVFVTAFGGAGAIGIHLGMSVLAASAVGFASGVVFGSGIYAFARFLYGQQATTEVGAKDIEGRTARVVVSIPAGGIGQVRLQIGEEIIDKMARTVDGSALVENTIVRVDSVLGEIVVVRPQQ